jgi:hypothetical protein
VRAAGQHLAETAAEHERLELQHAVQQPDGADGELEPAARVEGWRTPVSSGWPRDRVADGYALAHLPAPFWFH